MQAGECGWCTCRLKRSAKGPGAESREDVASPGSLVVRDMCVRTYSKKVTTDGHRRALQISFHMNETRGRVSNHCTRGSVNSVMTGQFHLAFMFERAKKGGLEGQRLQSPEPARLQFRPRSSATGLNPRKTQDPGSAGQRRERQPDVATRDGSQSSQFDDRGRLTLSHRIPFANVACVAG